MNESGEFYDLFDTYIKYGDKGSSLLHWDCREQGYVGSDK